VRSHVGRRLIVPRGVLGANTVFLKLRRIAPLGEGFCAQTDDSGLPCRDVLRKSPSLASERHIESNSMALPKRVGKYDVLFPLGSGGMATVVLARSEGLGGFRKEVAIKLSHPHLGMEHGFFQSLIDEAKLAARIRHPNVVTVQDVGSTGESVYLVMDYVEGEALSTLQRLAHSAKRTLPLPVSLAILRDALVGLHAAHEVRDEAGNSLEVVHRDFSPQNILVGTDGSSRLTDFGVASARSQSLVTEEGIIKGKLPYMAPEQIRGHVLDRRTDVFAAGVVAWELFAGRRLFGDKPDTQAMLEIISGVPPRLSTLRADLPEAASRAVAKALSREVGDRFATAEAFKQALLGAFPGETVADMTVVGQLVRDWARASLDERRLQLERSRQQRIVPVSEQSVEQGQLASQPSASSDNEVSVAVTTRDRLPPRRNVRKYAMALGSALVLAALVGIGLRYKGESLHATTPVTVQTVAATESIRSEPTRPMLELRANAPLKRVTINGVASDIKDPSDRAILGPFDPNALLFIEAESTRGDKVAMRDVPFSPNIVVAFSEKPSSSATAMTAQHAAPNPASKRTPKPVVSKPSSVPSVPKLSKNVYDPH
jgi:eukaryotic-like serine/threonine-protein kinase